MGLSYYEFGRHLLETYDLDPLYVVLAKANWPDGLLKRFLLAYTVFYSAGVAAYVAETSLNARQFYETLLRGNVEKWPRGHERRHLRGQQFVDCVNGLWDYGPPEKVLDKMVRGTDFPTMSKNVQSFCGYGPWISFKIFDLADRVLGLEKSLDDVDLFMYRDPVKGAALYKFGDQNHPITPIELSGVVASLQRTFRDYKAPPYQDRSLTVMETETILCKAKSNYNGHYPLGNDTIDIYHGLDGWGDAAGELKGSLKPYYDYWNSWPEKDRKVRIEL